MKNHSKKSYLIIKLISSSLLFLNCTILLSNYLVWCPGKQLRVIIQVYLKTKYLRFEMVDRKSKFAQCDLYRDVIFAQA